jgi:prepilin-type N-terminal cleavage/methylation domain-containing protein/prepilin-type processing-associated H-X9-DG protein
MNCRAANRCGFTLIELLVVVAIIAILFAILQPALNRARGLAKQIVCQSNLRQIGLAIRFYADDNEGRFPLGDSGGWPGGDQWCYGIEQYLAPLAAGYERTGVYICPSKNNKTPFADYGLNLLLGVGWSSPITYSMVNRTSEVVLVGEQVGENWFLRIPTVWAFLGPLDGCPVYLHLNRSNVVFVDGHVEVLSPQQLEQQSNFVFP